MVSEPQNYVATFLGINIGMCLLYAFSTDANYWYLIVLAVLFHVATDVFMIFLALSETTPTGTVIAESATKSS